MPDKSTEFRQQLLNVQEFSPALRDAYEQELDAMLHPPMTVRSGLPGTLLLVVLIACIVLLARAVFFHHVGPLMSGGYAVLAAAFLWASVLIIRDLRKRKHSSPSVGSIAKVLTVAAGTITVVALMRGLGGPADPKSLFDAFYVFVFYFACAIWSLGSRIASAELASREQLLRIECRLADLADRLHD